jgi:hypothetical protein
LCRASSLNFNDDKEGTGGYTNTLKLYSQLCEDGNIFDEDGNIFDEDGNIFDEDGNIFDEDGNSLDIDSILAVTFVLFEEVLEGFEVYDK